jgi:hypothetical protein
MEQTAFSPERSDGAQGTPMNSDESRAGREQAARGTMIPEIREASCGDVCEFDFHPVILTFS